VSVWRTEYADEELQALPERSLKPLVAVAPECQVDSDPEAAAVSLVASAAIGVVTVAILARAYRDLRPEVDPDGPSGRAEPADADSPQGEPNPQ